ncbi:MAG: hypothetical protein ACT4QG_01170 [Sporichthyaceae bacterium]
MNQSDDDEIRRMLANIDPMAGVPVEPVTSPQARHLLEQIMQSTNTDDAVVTHLRRRNRRTILAAAASVAVLAIGIAVVQGNDTYTDFADPAATTLALKAASGSPASQLCLALDATELRKYTVAFAGTATTVGKDSVSLAVDRWYSGGDAERVTVSVPPDGSELSPWFEFVVGQRYLISADQGAVNGCGFSGPATPELTKTFDEAFPG